MIELHTGDVIRDVSGVWEVWAVDEVPCRDGKGIKFAFTIVHWKTKRVEVLTARELARFFREVDDGKEILDRLDVEHVLSRPDTCAWLRTLFAWCVGVLEQHPLRESLSPSDKYRLRDGILSDITRTQLGGS